MLRFQRNRPTSFQPPRAVRRKLWMYVALLGLVYFLATKAADPQTWHWLAPQPNGMEGADGRLMDTALAVPRRAERPLGAFTAESEQKPTARPQAEHPRLPGLREDLLRDLRDDDFFRPREHEAFFHLLKLLQESDDAALAAASSGKVAFAQLYRQPDSYRGEVVTVRGVVRRCNLLPAPPNDFGIAEYYEVWLQPDDNPTYPMKFYALTKPREFPTGDDVAENVDITGIFYRRLAYKAQDEPRTTPLVLARGIDWRRDGNAALPTENAATLFSAVAAGVVVLLIALVFFLTRGKILPRRAAPDAPAKRSLDSLRNAELAPSPSAGLRQMAEQMERDEAVDAILRPRGNAPREGR